MSRCAHVAVTALAAAALLALAGCGGSSKDSSTDASVTPATTTTATTPTGSGPGLGPAFGSMDNLPGVLKTAPPWDANTDQLQLRLRAIGLPALTAEGQVVHIHQHLDLFVDGKEVAVPDNIGIDPGGGFISPLHTHAQGDGV